MLARSTFAAAAVLVPGALGLALDPASPARSADARAELIERLADDAFPGTGGPGGDFDWHLPAGETVLLDTSFATIRGGPGGAATRTQEVQDGVVQVRNLVIPRGTTLVAQGPNALMVVATGSVFVDGRISVDGGAAQPVYTLNTPQIPEHGAPGNAGGGDGGTASRYTDRATPFGAPGSGAFGAPNVGGQGGESGWSPNTTNFGEWRRAAGGGGGVFGPDQYAAGGCPDQSVFGLDAESGFPGHPFGFSALPPMDVMPWGGRAGRGPFVNGDPSDDFWGRKIANVGTPQEELVVGELPGPWAGAGGGGGGDATQTDVYPPVGFVHTLHDKGAGGGGGAGALLILARGDIVVGPLGYVSANGGHGSAGENTNFVNRIGGGSGGGSGGHIVLSSLGRIDLSQLSPHVPAIVARGGQGGAGANNVGGAAQAEGPTPDHDARHRGSTFPGDQFSDNPWIGPVPMDCWGPLGVVRGAGGDGGPGVIQLHARDLAGILPPGGVFSSIRTVVRPVPVGFATPDAPVQEFVDLLLPTF